MVDTLQSCNILEGNISKTMQQLVREGQISDKRGPGKTLKEPTEPAQACKNSTKIVRL